MRDVFGPIYSNAAFAHLFPRDGQPAEDLARLALILIIQFAFQTLQEHRKATVAPLNGVPAPRAPVLVRLERNSPALPGVKWLRYGRIC